MASLKEVKNRINSVKSTRQITSAMKMVASAKLHKVQLQTASMLPYQQKLNAIVNSFLGTDVTFTSPYITDRKVERVAIGAFSSNSSLCGAYNSNVIRLLTEVANSYKGLGVENIDIYPVGRKIEEAVRKLGYTPKGSFQKVADKPSYDDISSELTTTLIQQFAAHEIDKVVLIYHHFRSMGSQVLTQDTLLPLNLSQEEKANRASGGWMLNYIVEPSVQELIDVLLPQVVHQKMYTVLLDSNTSEHAARTLAMQTATDNADDLVQDLTKQYNKSRQQAITNELLDIIGGSMK